MIRVQAGVTRKRGLPRFSSAQASCTIDAEVDGPWDQNPERLSETIRGIYQLCTTAVEQQLDRFEHDARQPEDPLDRPASAAQFRVLESLARRKRIDLAAFLVSRVNTHPSALTCGQASQAIDLLAATVPGRRAEPPRRGEPTAVGQPALGDDLAAAGCA